MKFWLAAFAFTAASSFAHATGTAIADPSVRGVSAPGMPLNAPGMGELDGNLVTVDFTGKPFSKD